MNPQTASFYHVRMKSGLNGKRRRKNWVKSREKARYIYKGKLTLALRL